MPSNHPLCNTVLIILWAICTAHSLFWRILYRAVLCKWDCDNSANPHFASFHQHPVQLHACSGGAALPVLVAAHLHPGVAWLHVGHRLLSHTLPGGVAVQLTAQTQRVTCRRGERDRFLLF